MALEESSRRLSAENVAERLELAPHPEGGFYREIYRSEAIVVHPAVPRDEGPERSAGTCMYYLLSAGDFSAFHRVQIHQDGRYEMRVLASDLEIGAPATTVEAGCLQAARVVEGGDWALCGCSVAPGFDFADLDIPSPVELARVYPEHSLIIRQLTRARKDESS